MATGLRIGEACGLAWNSVDLETDAIEVRAAAVRVRGQGLVVKATKTDAGTRTLLLPRWCVANLRERAASLALRAEDRGTQPIFPAPLGGWRDPSNTQGGSSRRLHIRAIPLGHLTRLPQDGCHADDHAGLSSRAAADQLGHANTSMTTDVYFGRKVAAWAPRRSSKHSATSRLPRDRNSNGSCMGPRTSASVHSCPVIPATANSTPPLGHSFRGSRSCRSPGRCDVLARLTHVGRALRRWVMRIAVFAGSQAGPLSHRRAAAALGTGLADAGVGIVYGAGHVGLMGSLSDAALKAGGEVIGVIPQHIADDELAHPRLSKIEIVMSLHERRARMADLADAFVVLPGGPGTLAEFFDAWSSGMLGLHNKPTALLDVDGYWQPLLIQLQLMSKDGYLEQRSLGALGLVGDAARLLAFIDNYEHPPRARRTTGRPAS
jgi:uncharacterized protein (TIGR00730 family)